MPHIPLNIANSAIRWLKVLTKPVRLAPFDVSTPEGRADERHRRAALTAIASALAKIVSIATAVISVPLTLHYLGIERYGMWMTMSSAVAMLNFADFGMGSGIVNAVAPAYGQDDRKAIREYVSSGYLALLAIALTILVLFAACYAFVPWYKIFNVTSVAARREAGPALAVLIGCFAADIPMSVIQRVQLGMQRGFLESLWRCFGSLLGLAGVITAVTFHASLPVLILAYVGSPLIAASLNAIVFFGWLEPDLAPKLNAVRRIALWRIAQVGVLFFILQIAGAVLYISDNIVIAQILGASAVTNYAVPQRLFSVIAMLLGMAWTPLWPAYGEAISRGDHQWVWRTLRHSFLVSVGLSSFAALVFVGVGNWIIHKWVGGAVTAPLVLLIGLGVWQVIKGSGGTASMFLNGANVVRFQMVAAILAAVVGITLKVYLIPIMGVAGAVWGTVIAYVPCVAVPTYYYIARRYRKNRRLHGALI